MLDLHTHILPGIDDGSRSVRQSIAMLKSEIEQGVDNIVFTPHFYARRKAPAEFLAKRENAFSELLRASEMPEDLPEIRVGAEVAYYNGISRAEELEEFCISGTNAMLIEMPFAKWTKHVLEEIDFIGRHRGIQPIIAHVERYMGFQPRGTVQDMSDEGIWIQVNASFFLNWRTRLRALRMLKKENIHFIGSDCHNMNDRQPNIGDAYDEIAARLGENAIAHLDDMEYRLLAD